MSQSVKTVILIPTYNERENVALLIPEIFALQPDVSVLVIDDNSPDGTGAEVRRLMLSYPQVALLSRPNKEGLGAAYKSGMAQVLQDPTVDAVITMDADGSHAAEYLSVLRELGKTHALVVGSRYVRGGDIESWEPWRFMLSKWGMSMLAPLPGCPFVI